MIRLTKAPRALLAAFEMKVLGQNPTGVEDGLRGTLDLYDQYMVDQVSIQTHAAPGVVAIGDTLATSHIGPAAGESWRVWGVGADLGIAAADTAIDVQGSFYTIWRNKEVTITPIQRVDGGILGGRRIGWWFDRPFFLTNANELSVIYQFSAPLTVAGTIEIGVLAATIRE